MYIAVLTLRKKQLRQAEDLIHLLQRQIRCYAYTVPDILKSAKNPLPLLRYIPLKEPFDLVSAYATARQKSRWEMFFRPSDWDWCDRLFFGLGTGDTEQQIKLLTDCESSVKQARQETERDLAKNGKAAWILGACSGAVLALMLAQ